MGLSRSTFYDAPPVPMAANEVLVRIRAICDEFECYGYRRVGAALRRKRCSPTLRRFVRSGWPFGCPEPRHQFVDAFVRPAIHQACQEIGKICLWIDAIQLTGFD